MTEDSLAEALSGTEEDVQQVETAETTAATVETQQVEETQVDPVAERLEAMETRLAQAEAYKTGMINERHKRQELEGQLEASKAEFDWTDPEAAINTQMDSRMKKYQEQVDNRFLNLSEHGAALRHKDDFAAVKDEFFNKVLPENPHLQGQIVNSPDPYEAMYQFMKDRELQAEVSEIDNMAAFKEKLREEGRREALGSAEAGKKAEIEATIRDSLPGSLSTAHAVGGNTAQPVANESLEDIFKR